MGIFQIGRFLDNELRYRILKNLNYWRLTPDFPVLKDIRRDQVQDLFMFHLTNVDKWINGKETLTNNKEQLFSKFYFLNSHRLTVSQLIAFFAEWEYKAVPLKAHEILRDIQSYYYSIAEQVEKINKDEEEKKRQQQHLITASEYAQILRDRGETDAIAKMFYNLLDSKTVPAQTMKSEVAGVKSVGEIINNM